MKRAASSRIILLLTTSLALAACGRSGNLEPRQGNSLPPKALGQTTEQTSDRLLTATPQQRPGRSDELLRRSERRAEDPFDLPPGGRTEESDSPKDSVDPATSDVEETTKLPN